MASTAENMEVMINQDLMVLDNMNVSDETLDELFPEFDDIWDDASIPQGIWEEAYLIY